MNTEPAKSKSFSLVVNNKEEEEVKEGSKEEETGGRKSEDVATTSGGEILAPRDFVLGEDFSDSSEVLLVRGGLEANTVRSVMGSSEAEVPVMTNKQEEEEEEKLLVEKVVELEKVEKKEEVEKEKQSRSIVSVRLGEEGSRFSFAKVISFFTKSSC